MTPAPSLGPGWGRSAASRSPRSTTRGSAAGGTQWAAGARGGSRRASTTLRRRVGPRLGVPRRRALRLRRRPLPRAPRGARPSTTKRRPRNICPRALRTRFFVHSDGARASFLFAQLPLSRSLRPRADVASLQAWAWWARVGDLTSPTMAHTTLGASLTLASLCAPQEAKKLRQRAYRPPDGSPAAFQRCRWGAAPP